MTADTTDDLQRLYHTSRWMRAARAFRRLHPLCARRCGALSAVVDHIVPRSTARNAVELHHLTWDRANWQALCKPCHDLKTFGERVARQGPTLDGATDVVTRDYTRRANDG